MPKKATVVPKPAIRGVQRPPPGVMLPPSNVTSAAGGVLNRLRPAASQSAFRAGTGSSSTRSSSTTTSSIAAKLSGVQRPTTVVSKAASAKPSGIATGIRPPSRVPTSSHFTSYFGSSTTIFSSPRCHHFSHYSTQ
ncbi:hypothetical protein QCA50_014311 [Cerrena zonata]|uniref:Uncharacterized protein n=1 Tax=Cerrena zonata TaxID=2478898 RepID=A0AAW0FNU8_9APHY